MRSPPETRLQQGATQISITPPKNLEIVGALQNSLPDEKICVAVGKDFSESVSALQWALKWAVYDRSLILLHVQVPIRFIPSPVGRIPSDQVSEDILNAHKEDDEKKLSECMEFFLEICSQAKVKGKRLIVEKADVSKGIVEVVSDLCITKLIIGTSSGGAISKKMKMQGSGKADYVLRHAIESCEVSIICKGKVVQLREASLLQNGEKAVNCRMLGERSESTTFKPCPFHGRLVSMNRNVQRNSNASSFSLVNEICNPAWVEKLNDPDFEASSYPRYSAWEEERNERIQGDEACGDTNIKPEACGNLSSIDSRDESQVCSLY